MKVILATGIYPPDIGGPATYVYNLAREFVERGVQVTVVTYGGGRQVGLGDEKWNIVEVERRGGPLLRWWRYVQALKRRAADADIVLAFSLVSSGVPLWFARLKKPKKILRLGGDFLWERYTDLGGSLGLREWYGSRFWSLVARFFMGRLLRSFNHIVFSTRFQEEIYEKCYSLLPPHSVVENAFPMCRNKKSEARTVKMPFRLLFLGRFVAFKNIAALLRAMTELPGVMLTLVGEGPLHHLLEGLVRGLKIQDRVSFCPKVLPHDRDKFFAEHHLLVLPSVTEISPNTALEARAVGLPVLLTNETGLSEELRRGMFLRLLHTPDQIRDALREVMTHYVSVAKEAALPPSERSWEKVCDEYLDLFHNISFPSP